MGSGAVERTASPFPDPRVKSYGTAPENVRAFSLVTLLFAALGIAGEVSVRQHYSVTAVVDFLVLPIGGWMFTEIIRELRYVTNIVLGGDVATWSTAWMTGSVPLGELRIERFSSGGRKLRNPKVVFKDARGRRRIFRVGKKNLELLDIVESGFGGFQGSTNSVGSYAFGEATDPRYYQQS